MLDIRLLGSPTVTVDDNLVEVDTRKAIALLAYLAVEGSADREFLSGLLWADSAPDKARATLRRTLSALRSGIGAESLAADRNRVHLLGDVRFDVERFQAAIAETREHGHAVEEVCARCVLPLTTAANLYRGDFLGSFTVRDAPEFEEWVRTVTESYRLEAGEVFQKLAMALASEGDYHRALAAAGRWLGLDELHEPAHRLIILLHAWDGDRPGAIQAYRDCVAILDRELGVTPLEETTELYEAILDEDLPPAPGVRRSVKTIEITPAPDVSDLLDRTAAIEALETAVREGASRGTTCLITGAPWMGKTRLIDHIARHASDKGLRVITGKAYRAETTLPYGVATQLLTGLMEAIDPGGLPRWAIDELGRLDPKLTPSVTKPGPEREGQLRMREAFLTIVLAAVDAGAVLIAVDDAQWLDPASAAILAYLFRRVDALRGLLLLSTREEEALPPALREVGTAEHRIHLGPLTVEDLRPRLKAEDLEGIISETGGIPLLVMESLDSGKVAPDSVSVSRYLESRRQRLSELSRQVLAAAAVLDGMCDASLLRDTSGRTDDELVDAVEELVTAGLLKEEAEGRLGFSLDVLETVTYESTSLTRRRLLHRRAAEALQARSRSHNDVRAAAAIAGHLRAAGSPGAADWYQLAGDLARKVFANDEATTSYETAIALGHPDIAELHLALGDLALARGDYQTATRELRTAVAQSEGGLLATVEHRIGNLNRLLGRFDLAEESYSRAEPGHPDLAELYADWALLHHRIHRGDDAVRLATRSLELAEAADDPALIGRAHNILGVVSPDPAQAIEHLEAALAMAASTDPDRMAALNNMAHLLAGSGDIEGAMSLVDEAVEIADRAGYRHQQAALLNHLADLNHQAGRDRDAETLLTSAVTLFADIDAGDWEPEVWLLREW